MKKYIKGISSKIALFVGVLYGIFLFPGVAYASGLDKITSGMDTIKTFFTGVVAVVGVIIFVRNALDFGTAIQDRDRNGMVSGLLGMVGGGVIAAAGTIITLFV